MHDVTEDRWNPQDDQSDAGNGDLKDVLDGTCVKRSVVQEKSNVDPTVTCLDMFQMDWIGLTGCMHSMGKNMELLHEGLLEHLQEVKMNYI